MVYLLNNKLLIIGNGFDLHLGLKSSFGDFLSEKLKNNTNLDKIIEQHYNEIPESFNVDANSMHGKHREKTIKNLETMLDTTNSVISTNDELITLNGKNFWTTYMTFLSKFPDFDDDNELFRNKNNTVRLQNWSDVEFQIQYALESSENIFKKIRQEIKKSKKTNKSLAIYIYDLLFNISNAVTYHSVIAYNVVFFALCSGWKPFDDEIYDFLFKELYKFEKDFKIYLQTIIHNSIYFYNANRLAESIAETKNYSLINFNYSSFYDTFDSKKRNIHSNLGNDGHPIFGISSIDKNQKPIFNKPYYKFSKTYRIMSLAKATNSKEILDDYIDEIIFYGHSLSKADYLYFKTIINRYVNNKNVIFTFKYSDYRRNNKLYKMENYQIEKVYNLFNNIGFQDNDNSLLQQLLLEQRIRIEKFTR
ncbi:hypothetical protein AKUH4B410M_09510 [Apilactobacillus kunkeei]|nr:hypothetical protein AKUH4B405J_09510 [Apilactobacillus kunkeei]CAI2619800.1 hypothetical protein AKUH4B410M_09510 [Apilactobacillus kunkeei]CAI2620090.1 hypothetical protein AKUH4B102A_09780 [Apilactobacillus kunkeei]CAI2684261.1 hypothetical protein AKUH3B102X_09500 [Apilactobacillus kunkeei]